MQIAAPQRLFLMVACVWLASFATAVDAAERPHIIVITADDMGLETGAYGKDWIPTPQMDRLARMGVIFDNAHVTQSSCSSSRASLMTGLYPHQNGQWGLQHLGFRMKTGVPILPNILAEQGYRTAIIGKLHVGSQTPFRLTELEEDIDRTRWMRRTRYVKRVAERVSDFIARSPDEPAFVKLSYLDPHRPWDKQIAGLPENPLTLAETPLLNYAPQQTYEHGIRLEANGYLNNMKRLDVGIGMLLDRLEADGVLQDTAIIFFGDNGPPLERAKGTCWEAGVRVPMIVVWPGGGVPRDRRTNAIVSTLDIFATVLEIARVEPPAGSPSRSFLSVLRNPEKPFRKHAFTQMNYHGTDAYRPWRTVSDGRHKLHFRYDLSGAKEELLFDLQKDPWEENDLSNDEASAAIAATLRERLEDWQRETDDPFVHPEFLQDFGRLGLSMREVEEAKPYVPKHSPLLTAPPDDQTYAEWFVSTRLGDRNE